MARRILIAPDKYRGTLSAREAAEVISGALGPRRCMLLPMADGGEGTAECIAAMRGNWQEVQKGVFFNAEDGIIAIDSSAIVGYESDEFNMPPLLRSTAPLGKALNKLYHDFRPRKIYLGIGGTACCDVGEGLMGELNPEVAWREVIVGLADVAVPLLPDEASRLSALSFCRQKGFSDVEINETKERLERLEQTYGKARSPYAGAGGGLGYAVAHLIGAQCYAGAEWLLERAEVPWEELSCVITGEGCYDEQTESGKVVAVMARAARHHGIPCYCLAGTTNIKCEQHTRGEKNHQSAETLRVISCDEYLPHLPLTPETARLRLAMAAENLTAQLTDNPPL
ncbi:MAG: glycerate kinase [Muribaculaceae bacterium]|nr:glycerate kinase [Muribaculaceae bacterium]